MRLYIANPSKQYLVMHYRKPGTRNVLAVRIQPGGQEMVEDDRLTKAEIDAIVEQNEIFGLVNIADVGKSTKGGTVVPRMVFSIDKAIVLSKIYEALEAQDDRLRKLNDDTRINTVAGLQRNLEDTHGAEVNILETEIVQVDEKGKPMTGPDAVNSGVTIGRPGTEAFQAAAALHENRTAKTARRGRAAH